jgi:hypothetical protein
MELTQGEAVELSRLLFEAREEIAMWADVVERRTVRRDPQLVRLLADLDRYRARCGWDPDGFGGEGPVRSDQGPDRSPALARSQAGSDSGGD